MDNMLYDLMKGTPLSDLDRCILIPEKSTTNTRMPEIKDVIFNDPATIVFWEDGTKTIVKCQKGTGDIYSKETGLAMAIAKKAYSNKGNFNNIFNKWLKVADQR